PRQNAQQQAWSRELLGLLQAIQREPAVYVMVRRDRV
ncbi:formate hydrogenlyase maturation protein HycH, partial [Cronobacter sakazakii]|nr:formate hydrogenlyase maturation protein HycH [Cronobacter sakazakii]MBF4970557.1 formate hydrogenlyase maturation protein HycH [Cronobacter sakazakii]